MLFLNRTSSKSLDSPCTIVKNQMEESLFQFGSPQPLISWIVGKS